LFEPRGKKHADTQKRGARSVSLPETEDENLSLGVAQEKATSSRAVQRGGWGGVKKARFSWGWGNSVELGNER